MSLTKSIAEYWAVGKAPPDKCVLQLVGSCLLSVQDSKIRNIRLQLSDGQNISSLFFYKQDEDIRKHLPTMNSIISLKDPRTVRYRGYNFHYFSDFDVVLESQGKIKTINSPKFLASDPFFYKNSHKHGY